MVQPTNGNVAVSITHVTIRLPCFCVNHERICHESALNKQRNRIPIPENASGIPLWIYSDPCQYIQVAGCSSSNTQQLLVSAKKDAVSTFYSGS